MTTDIGRRREVPRLFWIALVACAVYVVMAAGLGNLLSAAVDGENHPIADWLAGTWIPVGIMIIVGLYFARRSGWWKDIWHERPVAVGRPRRWWWLAAPLLSLVSTVILFSLVPWSEASAGIIVVVLIGALGVGVGEELYFRGILVTALRAHHSEFVVLIVSSVMFGLAHVVGYLIAGLPLGLILFQVAFISMDGALYYAARRATGRLWAPMLLHGLNDAALFLQTAGRNHEGAEPPATTGVIEIVLIALSVAIAISVLRETLRDRRERRATADTVEPR
ncbi:CPBP family intramembrane glutamic endopeptidase [Curtobacterium sp. MWU13-2055]|uniref:CPBP family intramembrane glutamic endopeptidase n=1 Tax=Curtobacterium sp. MWU13-2055 TaxID=2931928 RepID=UPI00200BCFB6|nr:type II CAAX endopeptidase family protein [Curtobacterium sp. MWU13-2055]